MASTGVSDPGKVAKVGDTPADIVQGHAAGCRHVVGVTSGSHRAEELRPHGPTHLIARLSELQSVLVPASEGAA